MTILAMLFGGMVGVGVMACYNNHSYNQGYREGEALGFEVGYKEGFGDGTYRASKVVPFPEKEVSK